MTDTEIIDEMEKVLLGYAKWEADLIIDNRWDGKDGFPTLRQSDYDVLIALQTERNIILAAIPGSKK